MAQAKISQADVKRIQEFSVNPNAWVNYFFSEAIAKGELRPTSQQRHAWDELGKLLRTKIKLRDNKRLALAGKPEKLLTPEEKKYAAKFGISIMSGNGTGKDCWAAITALYFETTFPEARGIATANTDKQLKNVLWSEIRKWMSKSNKIDTADPASKTFLEHMLDWQAEKISFRGDSSGKWFVEATTINTKKSETEQAESIAGRHEEHMLILVDEASGIANAVFNKFEATMTEPVNVMLIIFNPTRSQGYAVDSQRSGYWISLRWNAEESENVDKEHIARIESKYGRDSNPFRIRVLGLPPIAESDTLIPWDWIENAVNKELRVDGEPIIKGVDVGAGGDKSVIATRQGGKIYSLRRNNSKDTMVLVSVVSQDAEASKADAIMIDPIGIGKGAYDRLRQSGKRVFPVDVRRAARDPERFWRLRDELWWNLREQFESGVISIPDDNDLKDQLGAIKWRPDESNGVIRIMSKKEMRGELEGGSPDEADAVMLTYFMSDSVFRRGKDRDRGEDAEEEELAGSWRTA